MAPNVAEAGYHTDGLPVKAAARSRKASGGATDTAKPTTQRALVLPTNKPPFTLGDIKKAIPAHCFQPTLVESFGHLAKDLLWLVAGWAAILLLDNWLVSLPLHAAVAFPLRLVAWAAYTFLQGVTMTGLWVIAHECGHGGFSTSETINDIVGFIVHTALYVPYFAWQRSHSNHHHYTNNLAKDEVFVPERAKPGQEGSPKKSQSPVATFFHLIAMLVFGWPLYLLINSTSHKTDQFANHFLPSSSMFKPNDYYKVVLSNLGLVAWTGVLVWLGQVFGSSLILRLYLPPLLVTNAFLVAITFLQHTDHTLPHYDESEWNWLRGALCTVDRTMGRWLDERLHFIHSTHVCHHIFSRLPFYRAEEATKAMISVLGPYYNITNDNFFVTLYTNFRDCSLLENGQGILYFVQEHLDK